MLEAILNGLKTFVNPRLNEEGLQPDEHKEVHETVSSSLLSSGTFVKPQFVEDPLELHSI